MPTRTLLPGLSRRLKTAAILLLVAVITALHLLTPMPRGHDMRLHAVHTVLEGLYYLPILMAGFAWGLRGGLSLGLLVDLIYAAHTHIQLGGLLDPANQGRLLALLIFPLLGAATGYLTDALHRESRALVEAERQLRRAEMLSALGELSAGLAHEIRNPLAAIRGAADVLGSALPAGSRDEEYVLMLRSEVDRLDRVLSDFLLFARPGHPDEQVADAAACVKATFALLAAAAERAKVTLSLSGEPVALIRCPPEALRQVFLNLVLNSLQAIGAGGGAVTVHLGNAGLGTARIVVDDTGPGVPPADRERIFRPFFTTKPGGTGLGLSVVAKIVEGCGGAVAVGDADGRGARFTVTLPAAPEGTRAPLPEVIG